MNTVEATLSPGLLRTLRRTFERSGGRFAGADDMAAWCQDGLARHQTNIREHFEDLPKVRDGKWSE